MKIKQELVSLVTMTFNSESEQTEFLNYCEKFKLFPMSIFSEKPCFESDKLIVKYFFKLSNFPKVQRFVRNFKTKDIT